MFKDISSVAGSLPKSSAQPRSAGFLAKEAPKLSYGVIRTWFCRLTPFLCFPNLTLECCKILQQCLLGLTVMSTIIDEVSSPLTMGLLQLELRGLKKLIASPLYRGKILLHDALAILFLLASRARTPSELNMRYLRPYCRVLAHILRTEKTRETWQANFTLNYLLRYASMWSQLTVEQRCFVYCVNVYIAHCLFESDSCQIISNQFILDSCRQTIPESTTRTLKPYIPALSQLQLTCLLTSCANAGKEMHLIVCWRFSRCGHHQMKRSNSTETFVKPEIT